MKRVIAWVAAAVLALGLLGGCAKTQDDVPQTTGGTSEDVTMAVVVAGAFGDLSLIHISEPTRH